jgi:hypothetical protein
VKDKKRIPDFFRVYMKILSIYNRNSCIREWKSLNKREFMNILTGIIFFIRGFLEENKEENGIFIFKEALYDRQISINKFFDYSVQLFFNTGTGS